MAAKVFAVVAALLLVAAVAIGTLTPQGLTLGQGVLMLDGGAANWLRQYSPAWLYNWVEMPLLVRPLWLIPACLGVISAGMATSFGLGDATPRRRRS